MTETEKKPKAMTIKKVKEDWDRIMNDLVEKPEVAHVFGAYGRSEAVMLSWEQFCTMYELYVAVNSAAAAGGGVEWPTRTPAEILADREHLPEGDEEGEDVAVEGTDE